LTVSESWWSGVKGPRWAGITGLALTLTACGGTPPEAAVVPRAPLSPPPTLEAPVAAAPAAGLAPLATPQQVVQAVPMGRLDPFAAPHPPGTAAGGPSTRSTPQPLSPPAGFRLTGVIATGGRPEALVVYGNRSGSLVQGERGGGPMALLPAGWQVAAIDGPQGALTLRYGRQLLRLSL